MLHHPVLYHDAMLVVFLGGVSIYSSGVTFMTLLQIHAIWKVTQIIWHWQEYGATYTSIYDLLINSVLDTICGSYHYTVFYGICTYAYLILHWFVWGIDNNIIYIPMLNMNYFVFHKSGSQYTFSFKNPMVIWNPSVLHLSRDPSISNTRLCGECPQEEVIPEAEVEIVHGEGEEEKND
jgi:hypothetical protein